MIIEIESYLGDYIIEGKGHTKAELEEMLKNIVNEENYKNCGFVKLFCQRYSFKLLKRNEKTKSDYVIDLDTYQIYKLKYK